jgi:hypothetical protein
MSDCNVCGKTKSRYLMNNKAVCFRCDELLFDIEIECGDDTAEVELKTPNATAEKKLQTVPSKK